MKEIVAARIGTLITNKAETIRNALERDAEIEWLDRDRMKFMASLDLGEKWVNLANGKTFFCFDDNGRIHPPTEKF